MSVSNSPSVSPSKVPEGSILVLVNKRNPTKEEKKKVRDVLFDWDKLSQEIDEIANQKLAKIKKKNEDIDFQHKEFLRKQRNARRNARLKEKRANESEEEKALRLLKRRTKCQKNGTNIRECLMRSGYICGDKTKSELLRSKCCGEYTVDTDIEVVTTVTRTHKFVERDPVFDVEVSMDEGVVYAVDSKKGETIRVKQ